MVVRRNRITQKVTDCTAPGRAAPAHNGLPESTQCYRGSLTMVATKTRPRCDQTAAWGALQKHFENSGGRLDLREAFRSDVGRFEALSQQAPHVFADLSKN